MSFDWSNAFTPGASWAFYRGWRAKQLVNAASLTSAELDFMASKYGAKHARSALALEWQIKGLRGTGPYGSNPMMYHSRSLVRGGIPYDQVIAHKGRFLPGWTPKRIPHQRLAAARFSARALPIIGWGLLAYDVYDVVVNRSLWGIDLT